VLILTLSVIYTPGAYRFARALAVNINTMEFMTVARIRGERLPYLIRRGSAAEHHRARAGRPRPALRLHRAVLSGLSFLGLGVQPPDADWGALVRENIGGLPFGAPAVIFPSLAIRQPDHRRQPADRQPAPQDPRQGRRLMPALVEIRDLKVEATTDAGRMVEIIKGVSLDIAEGEIVALIGESGSGKTTIAMTLLGYARPGCRISAVPSASMAATWWP